MEELFKLVGGLLECRTEIVNEIKYLDREMGYNMIVCLKNGKEAIVSIIDNSTENNPDNDKQGG